MKRSTWAAGVMMTLWLGASQAQDGTAAVIEGRGGFEQCRASRLDYDTADADYKSLWQQRETALAQLDAGQPFDEAAAGELSRMDLHAHLRGELLKAVIEVLVGAAIDEWHDDRSEARRLTREFASRERQALREIADTIEREVVQRPGGRSAALESRIAEIYRQQLEPKLRRLEGTLKPRRQWLGHVFKLGAAIDVVHSFANSSWDLASRMLVAEGRNRQILQVELHYMPLLAEAQRRLAAAEPLVRGRCHRRADVDARQPRSATGTRVRKGECLRIAPDPASRVVWTRQGGAEVSAGPQGADVNALFGSFTLGQFGTLLMMERRPLKDAPPAALLLSVLADDGDDEAHLIAVGAGGFLRMPADGELAFQVNDGYLANNRGRFQVDFELAGDAGCGS